MASACILGGPVRCLNLAAIEMKPGVIKIAGREEMHRTLNNYRSSFVPLVSAQSPLLSVSTVYVARRPLAPTARVWICYLCTCIKGDAIVDLAG